MSDNTTRLGLALYGREPYPREWGGGSDARMLLDAANEIAALREQIAGLEAERLGPPNHPCGFFLDPEGGACEFHEEWAALLDRFDLLPAPEPTTGEEVR